MPQDATKHDEVIKYVRVCHKSQHPFRIIACALNAAVNAFPRLHFLAAACRLATHSASRLPVSMQADAELVA